MNVRNKAKSEQEEPDWEEIEKHLSEFPELSSEQREQIEKNAALQRMLRLASEGKWEEFTREWDAQKRTFQLEEELSKQAIRKFHYLGWQQAIQATGERDDSSLPFRLGMLYRLLNPQDGIESALAPAIVAMNDLTTECVRRASMTDALPVRDLELNHAMKAALVLSELSKAFDNHRHRLAQQKKAK